MKVIVYWNVRKGLLSVKALEGADKGRVVAHAEQLLMKDVQFSVSEAGRRRVVKEKRKNVHAGARGVIEAVWGAMLRPDIENTTIKGLAVGKPWRPIDGEEVRYNPYETKTFIRTADQTPVTHADLVKLDGCRVYATGLR